MMDRCNKTKADVTRPLARIPNDNRQGRTKALKPGSTNVSIQINFFGLAILLQQKKNRGTIMNNGPGSLPEAVSFARNIPSSVSSRQCEETKLNIVLCTRRILAMCFFCSVRHTKRRHYATKPNEQLDQTKTRRADERRRRRNVDGEKDKRGTHTLRRESCMPTTHAHTHTTETSIPKQHHKHTRKHIRTNTDTHAHCDQTES